MREKLKESFKGYIKFCQQEGKSDGVVLNSSASKLLPELHLEREKKDKNEVKLKVIRTAARLIFSDIISLDVYSD